MLLLRILQKKNGQLCFLSPRRRDGAGFSKDRIEINKLFTTFFEPSLFPSTLHESPFYSAAAAATIFFLLPPLLPHFFCRALDILRGSLLYMDSLLALTKAAQVRVTSRKA